MLEEPRLLLLRALDPLYPREPPPNALRSPAPLRETFLLPMLSAPPDLPPRLELPARLLRPVPPERLLAATPPARSPRPPLAGGLLVRFPPCRPICCRAPDWR